MRKYVLNIDKLYCGETANSLVLRQVDSEFPKLVPSLPSWVDENNYFLWVRKQRKMHSDFNPPTEFNRDWINDYIVDFNISLQNEFKNSGHDELYMMDDTRKLKTHFSSHKQYVHSLNGVGLLDDDDSTSSQLVNVSQLNVLFPFKKMSSKSIYSHRLNVISENEVDDWLENFRQITLQGKVSYQQCLQGIA